MAMRPAFAASTLTICVNVLHPASRIDLFNPALLDCDCATKIFLLGLLVPVVLCFIRGKGTAQVANQGKSIF